MEGRPPEIWTLLSSRLLTHYRNGAPAHPPTTFGTSLGVQSLADRQPLPLTGEYFQGPTSSQDGLQANRDTTKIPIHSVPEPVANNGVRTGFINNRAFQMQSTAPIDTPLATSGLLASVPTPNRFNLGQDGGNVGCVLPSTSIQSFSQ